MPILTVGELAALVPKDTKIYFRNMSVPADSPTPAGLLYVPADSVELVWNIAENSIQLNPERP